MNISKLFALVSLGLCLSAAAQSPVFGPPTPGPQIFTGPVSTPTMKSSVRPAVDVTAPPFNAAMDCVTDDTAALNAAIAAAHRSTVNCGLGSTSPTASCTGVVLIPNGCLLASQIVMQSNVTLQGTGWQNSLLLQKAGSNEHFIVGTTPSTDQRFNIHDLFINGNASNQVGTTWDCINLNGTGALGSSTRSPRHTLQNLFVANCSEDAISIYGDAGSDYLINVKGMNSGRFGLNLNVFDSHVDIGEFASNGTAGINLGTNGNGSIASTKDWGNGTGTTGTVGDGIRVNSGSWRLVNNEVQDNVCNGLVMTATSDMVVTGLFTDGNGNSPSGGNGCAGLVLNGVTNAYISGEFRAQVDAGKSDYAISFVGTNSNLVIDLPISTASAPAVSSSTGTIGQTNIWRGNTVNGNLVGIKQQYLNGIFLFGFSDTGATRTWGINSANGAATWSQYTVATLPSASTAQAGAQVVVTDATTFTPGICTGGGSDFMIAVSNGTTWSCH